MKDAEWKVTGVVERFERPGGWHYVRVPAEISAALADRADRGVIAVDLQCGSTPWQSSLLPYGDGGHFIPLSKLIRRKNNLDVGDRVTVAVAAR